MDGESLLAAIKEDATIAKPYVITITAHAIEGYREKYLEAGSDDYLSKPINHDEFYQALDKAEAKLDEQENSFSKEKLDYLVKAHDSLETLRTIFKVEPIYDAISYLQQIKNNAMIDEMIKDLQLASEGFDEELAQKVLSRLQGVIDGVKF